VDIKQINYTSHGTGAMSVVVDAEEIKRLGKRFRKLDLDQSGSLSVEEFMSLPELHQNPLVQRVIDIFDTDGNGEVDFKGKLRFSPKFICSKASFIMIMLICNVKMKYSEILLFMFLFVAAF